MSSQRCLLSTVTSQLINRERHSTSGGTVPACRLVQAKAVTICHHIGSYFDNRPRRITVNFSLDLNAAVPAPGCAQV